jgi:hypothetical protein
LFFWNTFKTSLEQAWNIVGTIGFDFEIVTRYFGTGVERAWNERGTLGGYLGVHET